MTIKQEKNGTFTVRYAKRHPVTLQSVGLLRKGIKTKAEAARVEKELIVAVAERLTRAVIPTWSQCVEEWQETARAVNHEWYPHWAVALYTGMRNGEIYALRWDCVDLETSVLRVKATWNGKDGYKPPKSWEERVVEIAPALLPVLKRLKLQTGESGFVLPRIEDWNRGEQARVLRTFLAGMGQPAIRFHDLRASWATLLLLKGVEPIKVMAMGGWKDLKTLMKYVRIAAVDIRGATSKLNFHDDSKREGEVLRFPVESVGGV